MLIFKDKLPSQNREAIIEKINSVSNNLGINPNWLMAVMNFESNLNPKAKNPYSGATGLIQFMPTTAASLGTSTTQLYFMPFENQLDFVERYYSPYKTKIKNFQDLYLATFYPIAIGKPSSYIIGSHKGPETISVIAKQNPIFDPLKTGKVTVGAIKKVILAKVPKDYLKYITATAAVLPFAFMGLGVLTWLFIKNLD